MNQISEDELQDTNFSEDNKENHDPKKVPRLL